MLPANGECGWVELTMRVILTDARRQAHASGRIETIPQAVRRFLVIGTNLLKSAIHEYPKRVNAADPWLTGYVYICPQSRRPILPDCYFVARMERRLLDPRGQSSAHYRTEQRNSRARQTTDTGPWSARPRGCRWVHRICTPRSRLCYNFVKLKKAL